MHLLEVERLCLTLLVFGPNFGGGSGSYWHSKLGGCILDNEAEEEHLCLRFKREYLHPTRKSGLVKHRLNRFDQSTTGSGAEEEHLCRKFDREKTYLPEKKSELAGSHLDRSDLYALSGHDAYRPQRAVKFKIRPKFPPG